MIPYPIGTKFATDVLVSYGSQHTKFEENCLSRFRDTSEQKFILISWFFSSTSFRTLRKIRHNTRIRVPIELKFGTHKGLIKADLSTNFGRNPMNIHCNSLASCFRSHDRENRRTYEQRVREIERASFTPLVFSALGGTSKPTETTYKRLASLLATKKNQQ